VPVLLPPSRLGSPRGERLRQGTFPRFSFATPPSATSPVAWYKADSLVLGNNDVVNTWPDLSGLAHDLTATGTAQPTYKTGILNGLPMVRFDGVANILSFASDVTWLAGNLVMFIVYVPRGRTAATFPRHVSTVGASGSQDYAGADSFAFITYPDVGQDQFFNAGVAQTAQTSSALDVGQIHTLQGNAGGLTHRYNRAAASPDPSGVAATYALRTIRVGASGNPSEWSQADYGEVLLYAADLSSTERDQIETYLATKWGLVATVTQTATATVTTTATTSNLVGKPVSAPVTTTASVVKIVAKSITATVTSAASAIRRVLTTKSAPVTTTATSTKQVGKPVSATVTSTASGVKRVNKTASATATSTASTTKQVNKPVSATVTSGASVLKRVGKLATATVTTAASAVRRVATTKSATVTTTATATRQTNKPAQATVTSTASAIRSTGKTATATVTSAASTIKQAGKRVTATVTTSASALVTKVILIAATATVTATASVAKRIGKSVGATVSSIASSVVDFIAGIVAPPPPAPPVTGTFRFGRTLITEYPAGTQVGIYAGVPNGPPPGSPISTAIVSENLTVTLPIGPYYLAAELPVLYRPEKGLPYFVDEWRFVDFLVQ
jgi:hypothetical protein